MSMLVKLRHITHVKKKVLFLLICSLLFAFINMQAPEILTNGGATTHSVSVIENNTFVIIDYEAIDADGALEGTGIGKGLDYSINGIDAPFFSIQDDGRLSFNSPPDFATPLDNNGDNNYEITIIITDEQGLMDTQNLTVTVMLQDPEPSFPCTVIQAEIGSLDRMHFIPPIYAKDGLGTGTDIDNHYLWLATPQATPMTVTIQNADGFNGVGGGINETVVIDKNNPALVTLSAGIYGSADYGATGIVNDAGLNTPNTTDGLILTSPNKFYANLRHSSNSQGGSLTSKGQVALGIRFRSGHLNMTADEGTVRKSHFIAVMAPEDNTTVNFSDISPGISFVGGNPSSVVLNKYESYVVGVRMDQANNDLVPNDLNGTLITASQPVVVNSGSFLAGSLVNSSSRDLGMDQIVPTKYIGTQFILVKGTATTNADVLETPIVIADVDNTQIFLKGANTPIATINAGDYYIISGNEYPASNTMLIRTSQPAYVYQTTNANDANGNGLNFIAPILADLEVQDLLIPAIDQLGDPILNFIAPNNTIITINGTDLTGGQAVTGISGFIFYTISGLTGDVDITATEPFFVSLTTEAGVRGSAGYFVGFPNSYAIRDRKTAPPATAVVLDLMNNDVFAGLDFSLNAICAQPTNGTVSINSDGTVTYEPNPGFLGVDTFQYNIVSTTGISDASYVYVAIDTDGDGIGDVTDIDIDNDGILNIDELGDSDNDLVIDAYDLDSDNDGIYDLIEAGHGAIDANNDGRVDDYVGTNGLLDLLETVAESNLINYTILNTDGTDLPDFLDDNSDNDGCLDVREAGFEDVDDNGWKGTGISGIDLPVNADGTVNTGGTYTLPIATNIGVYDFQDDQVNLCSEICDNARDDDDDGLIDLDDPDCVSPPDLVVTPIIITEDTVFDTCFNIVDANVLDTHAVTICQPPMNGVMTTSIDNINHQLCLEYTPNTGFTGMDSICVIICDQGGLCDTSLIPILVETSLTQLKLSVLLQGALLGDIDTLMRDDLRKNNLIPLTQPYVDSLPFNRFTTVESGTEMTTSVILANKPDTNNAIVDWVFIELRNQADSTQIIRTIAALVQRDGDIVAAETGGNLFAASLPLACFVAIKHRNHLGVMTATPILTQNGVLSVDFTKISSTDLFNFNGFDGAEISTINGKKALRAANAYIDNKAKYDGIDNDRIQLTKEIMSHAQNTTQNLNFNLATGYLWGDINMDGIVKYDGLINDRVLLQNIILTYPLNVRQVNNYSVLLEQIPE